MGAGLDRFSIRFRSSFCTHVENGFMPMGVWSRWRWRGSWWPVAVWLLDAALRWTEPEEEGGGAPTTPAINLSAFSLDLDISVLDLALPGHHGGGEGGAILDGSVLCRSTERRWR
jgi:hypothetical protein